MNILVAYRGIPHAPGWATGDHVCRALRRMGHHVTPYGNVYHSPARMEPATISALAPDLIIYLECGDEEPQYVELAERKCPLVYWDFDTALHPDGTKALVTMLRPEVLFIANRAMMNHFPQAHYLPYGVDPGKFRPMGGERTPPAILGTRFPSRVMFADRLGVEVREVFPQEKYARELARLKVCVHHTNSGGDGLLVMRYWEALACGVPLLCPEGEEVNRHFCTGEHLFTYRDVEQAREVLWNLEHAAGLAPRVATAGHAEVVTRHTYEHRCMRILEAL